MKTLLIGIAGVGVVLCSLCMVLDLATHDYKMAALMLVCLAVNVNTYRNAKRLE